MAERNRTAEILEVKSRGPKTAPEFHREFEMLQAQWLRIQRIDATADDFFPIRAVTLLEVFSGAWIAQLIDHGPPFVNNAVDLAKNLRPDYELIRAIHGRTITLGDMIAHNISFRAFGQICSCFKILIGEDLIPLIETAVDRRTTLRDLMSAQPAEKKMLARIIPDVAEMCRPLSRLFEVRHILVHEFPQTEVYDRAEIAVFLKSAEQFAHATNEALNHLLFGDAPRTMQGMKERAGQSLEKSQAELAGIMERLRNNADRRKLSLLKRSEKAWLTFRKAECDVRADLTCGGTLAGYLALLEADALTKTRIEQLRRYLAEEGD
jgi:uncharacterized protein YecT (DUF1311 family)